MGRFDVVRQSIAGIPIAFYGFAFQKAWVSVYTVPGSMVSGATGLDIGGLLNAVFALAFAVILVKTSSETAKKVALPCAVILQIAAAITLAAVYQNPFDNFGLLIASLILQSAGLVLMSMLWIDLYASLNPIRVAFMNAAAIIIAAAFIFTIEANPIERVFAILMVLPILSGLCLRSAAKTRDAEKNPLVTKKARFLFPHRAVAFIAAYSFAYGVAAVIPDVVNGSYASVIPAAIVIVLILVNMKHFNISSLLRLAFPLMVAGFLLVALIPGVLQPLPSIMLNSGFSAMQMLLLLIVCTISYSTGASAFWLFGLLGGTQFLARFLGSFLSKNLNATAGSTEYIVLQVAVIVVVVVASLALASEKSVFSYWGAGHGEDDASSEDEDSYVRARISMLGESYSLTDREIEVSYLLAQGKTNIEIAQDMFVSENTVKAHLHHIYQKAGIHTRKELMTLIERNAG